MPIERWIECYKCGARYMEFDYHDCGAELRRQREAEERQRAKKKHEKYERENPLPRTAPVETDVKFLDSIRKAIEQNSREELKKRKERFNGILYGIDETARKYGGYIDAAVFITEAEEAEFISELRKLGYVVTETRDCYYDIVWKQTKDAKSRAYKTMKLADAWREARRPKEIERVRFLVDDYKRQIKRAAIEGKDSVKLYAEFPEVLKEEFVDKTPGLEIREIETLQGEAYKDYYNVIVGWKL